MGRIVDLLGEVAAAADEGREGLVLSVEDWERFRADWRDEDIEDALSLVHDSLLQGELLEASDSLSARMLEVLGAFGDAASYSRAQAGDARLEVYRDGRPPDRRGFDELRRRLADHGIEDEMRGGASSAGEEEEEEEED